MATEFRSLGFGLGLRQKHVTDVLADQHRVQWFEALTENYLGLPGIGPGPALEKLLRVRTQFPIVLHGVSLSIGSTEPLSNEYLDAVKNLINVTEPKWVSDHLCWTGVHGRNSHDLLPLPYTDEVVDHLVSRIQKVQETWQRPLVIENVSSYVDFPESTMSESEFLRAIVRKSGCKLLLDVNNVYVSSRNHHFSPTQYLAEIPWSSVVQIHLAGHSDRGDVVIDTHDADIRAEVWKLYRHVLLTLAQNGTTGDPHPLSHVSTMIERDDNIPSLNELDTELNFAREIYNEVAQANTIGRPSNSVSL